jgi:enediyne biosynthesis protein E4
MNVRAGLALACLGCSGFGDNFKEPEVRLEQAVVRGIGLAGGNLDLVVNNFDEPVSVYRNTEAERRRAKVRLKGRVSNSHGIGATVRLFTAAGQQMRYMTLARGFMSSSEPVAHFGLGDVETIDRLVVEWPSGHVQEFAELAADHLYTVVEPATPAPQRFRRGGD